MYVIPFWSYYKVENGYVLTNWLSNQQIIAHKNFLDFLEQLYTQTLFSLHTAENTTMIEKATDFRILFESQDQAENWYDHLEQTWERNFPIIDQIELTNHCPYTCKMCPRTISMDRALGHMPLSLFEKVVTQINGKQTYMGLHHFGESLLHRGLADAVRIAKTNNILTGISCNPPSMHPQIGKDILEAGIANILFSFDSLDPTTYREIRGKPANFERGDQHLREFVRMRNEGHYQTFITLQQISMAVNEGEADEFLEYCQDVGVDRGVVIRLGRWDFDDDYIKEIGDFGSPGYKGYCSRPWSSIVVMWDGRVVPCCHDYNGAVVIGDLKTQTIEEVWNSYSRQQFRYSNYHSELCKKCAYSRWYREMQRQKEGFFSFHKERNDGHRMEWLNPTITNLYDGPALFNSFDIRID